MKVKLNNKIHIDGKSHEVKYLDNGVRITYESYNAVERFNGHLFDGDKWNLLFTIQDLGVLPDNSTYILDAHLREQRVDALYQLAKPVIDAILGEVVTLG